MSTERLEKTISTVNKRHQGERGVFFLRIGYQGLLEYLFEKSPKHIGNNQPKNSRIPLATSKKRPFREKTHVAPRPAHRQKEYYR